MFIRWDDQKVGALVLVDTEFTVVRYYTKTCEEHLVAEYFKRGYSYKEIGKMLALDSLWWKQYRGHSYEYMRDKYCRNLKVYAKYWKIIASCDEYIEKMMVLA